MARSHRKLLARADLQRDNRFGSPKTWAIQSQLDLLLLWRNDSIEAASTEVNRLVESLRENIHLVSSLLPALLREGNEDSSTSLYTYPHPLSHISDPGGSIPPRRKGSGSQSSGSADWFTSHRGLSSLRSQPRKEETIFKSSPTHTRTW